MEWLTKKCSGPVSSAMKSAPGPQQQNQYSLQDHLELKAMRNELLESRLAVARPMETQRKKKASLRKQVSDGYVAAV